MFTKNIDDSRLKSYRDTGLVFISATFFFMKLPINFVRRLGHMLRRLKKTHATQLQGTLHKFTDAFRKKENYVETGLHLPIPVIFYSKRACVTTIIPVPTG